MDIETTTVLGTLLRKAPLPEYCGTAYSGRMESGAELRLCWRPWSAGQDDAWLASVLIADRTLAAATGPTRDEAERRLTDELARLVRMATRRAA